MREALRIQPDDVFCCDHDVPSPIVCGYHAFHGKCVLLCGEREFVFMRRKRNSFSKVCSGSLEFPAIGCAILERGGNLDELGNEVEGFLAFFGKKSSAVFLCDGTSVPSPVDLHSEELTSLRIQGSFCFFCYADGTVLRVPIDCLLEYIELHREGASPIKPPFARECLRLARRFTCGGRVSDVLELPYFSVNEVDAAFQTAEQQCTLLAVGSKPTLAMHHCEDLEKTFPIYDTISNIAQKTGALLSTAASWLRSRPAVPIPKVSIQAAPTSILQQLTDDRREVQEIHDTFGRFVLFSDNLGRVSLFDLKIFVVVRMWKGYRNCCAFFLASKQDAFVVIACSRRETLRCWPLLRSGCDADDGSVLLIGEQPKILLHLRGSSQARLFYSPSDHTFVTLP